MGANITSFVEEISKGGVTKTNQYAVKISPPSSLNGLASNYGINFDDLAYRIQRVTLPSRQMKPIMQKSVFRELRPLPVGYNSLDDVTMQIVLSSDLKERRFFLAWQNRIFNEGGTPSYIDTVVGDMQVTTIGDRRDIIRSRTLDVRNTENNDCYNDCSRCQFSIRCQFQFVRLRLKKMK